MKLFKKKKETTIETPLEKNSKEQQPIEETQEYKQNNGLA